MTALTNEQRLQLQQIAEKLNETMEDVWDAYRTTLMSDAKSAVYGLNEEVKADHILEPAIRAELVRQLGAAWSDIVGGGTTYERAQKSHARLGATGRYIEELLNQTK
jgi:hypothetical protein